MPSSWDSFVNKLRDSLVKNEKMESWIDEVLRHQCRDDPVPKIIEEKPAFRLIRQPRGTKTAKVIPLKTVSYAQMLSSRK